ncbi:DUF4190 domain-containing protein [Streptomyces sp. NPDC048330]|uniref:DUF4190 domain-containing protein n=1 Tax=Streptomyces sp. NPDC048330 TaxID=3365533 RepID=UPI00371C3AAB
MTTPADQPATDPWAPPSTDPSGGSEAAGAPAHGPDALPGPGALPGAGTWSGAGTPATPPYTATPPYPARPVRTGLGVGALVIGVVGLVFAVIPFLFWLGGIMGVLALVLGIVGYGRASRGEATDRGQAVAGIALGTVALVVAVAWTTALFFLVWTVDDDERPTDPLFSASPEYAEPTPEPTTPSPTPTTPAPLAFGRTHMYPDGVKVTVSVPAPYRPDGFAAGYEKGDTALRVTITIVNGSDRPLDVTTALPDARDAEGAQASTIFDGSGGTEMFRGTVLPGKQAKAGYAFSLPADADEELQLELAPKLLEYDPVIWTGPVK